MSFIWLADKPLRTREQVAREVHAVALNRGLDELATVMALMCISVEVGAQDAHGNPQWWCPWNAADPDSKNYPYDSQSNDGRSVGYFQQQKGPKGELWWGSSGDEMTLAIAANNFFERLTKDYQQASGNASLAGEFIANVQQCAPLYRSRYATKWAEAWEIFAKATQGGLTPVQKDRDYNSSVAVEKVIQYPRQSISDYDGVPQQHSWDCGPASAQVILAGAKVHKSESYLIKRIGTTTAGTNHSGLITPILNEYLPGSGYKVTWLPKEPVPKTQIERLWKSAVKSIDANRGCIFNFVAPPSNFPRGTRGSVSPEYRGWNTIYHYVAGMGYAQDDNGSRHFWIADPGFRPFGYWCSLEQVASLIVPHSYAVATTAKPAEAPPPFVPPAPPTSQPEPVIVAPDRLELLWQEWNAFTVDDTEAVEAIVVRAKNGDSRAIKVLSKLEQSNPTALNEFLQRKSQ